MTETPTLREKKDCPIAYKIDSPVSLEKSGMRKKDTPCSAPSSVRERTISTRNRRNRAGIKYLFAASIPACTPRATTQIVISINNSCAPTAPSGFAMTLPNS